MTKEELIKAYPQLKLEYSIHLLYGDEFKFLNINRRQLYKVIARNLVDIASMAYSDDDITRIRGKAYLEHVLATESKDYELFDSDPQSVFDFFNRLKMAISDTEAYMLKKDGVKVNMAKSIISWVDEILRSLYAKENERAGRVVTFYITSKKGGSKKVTSTLSDELLSTLDIEADDGYGTGRDVSFREVGEVLGGVTDTRTIKKRLDKKGIKYYIEEGGTKLCIKESSLDILKNHKRKKGS